jgi:hypothetical protein
MCVRVRGFVLVGLLRHCCWSQIMVVVIIVEGSGAGAAFAGGHEFDWGMNRHAAAENNTWGANGQQWEQMGSRYNSPLHFLPTTDRSSRPEQTSVLLARRCIVLDIVLAMRHRFGQCKVGNNLWNSPPCIRLLVQPNVSIRDDNDDDSSKYLSKVATGTLFAVTNEEFCTSNRHGRCVE